MRRYILLLLLATACSHPTSRQVEQIQSVKCSEAVALRYTERDFAALTTADDAVNPAQLKAQGNIADDLLFRRFTGDGEGKITNLKHTLYLCFTRVGHNSPTYILPCFGQECQESDKIYPIANRRCSRRSFLIQIRAG